MRVREMLHNVAAKVLILVMVASLGVGVGACNVLSGGTSGATAPPPEIAPTSGPVTVAVDKQQYGPGWPITVTIHDGLQEPILARVDHTDCTVVELELWVNGAWETQAPCEKVLPKPHVAEIGPGTVFTQVVLGFNEFLEHTYGRQERIGPHSCIRRAPTRVRSSIQRALSSINTITAAERAET
jgi:hypothetical protein